MYQMKMLSHIWGQTDRPTNRLSDQLLELLEWLFATKNLDQQNSLARGTLVVASNVGQEDLNKITEISADPIYITIL